MNKINVQEIIDNAKFNKFHWQVLLWCAIIIIVDGYDLVIYGTVLPKLMEEWHLTPAEAGSLQSFALFGMMFGALFFGTIANRIGYKKAMIACVALFSTFTFICGFLNSPQLFGICRFFAGLGIGGAMPSAVALTTEYAPKKIRSTLATIMFSGYPIGGVLSATLGIFLIPSFGWRSVFLVGGLPLLLLPIIYKLLPESLAFLIKSGKNDEAQANLTKIDPNYTPLSNAEFEIPSKQASGVDISELFKNGRGLTTVMFWLAFFMCLLNVYGLNTWLPKLMTKAGYGLGSALTFLLVLNFGGIIGAVSGGQLGDKYNLRKTIIAFFSIAALSLVFLGLLNTMGLKDSTFMLYFLIGVAGATVIGTQILTYALVAQYYPAVIRTTGVGWASGIGRIGAIVGPMLGAALTTWNLPFEQNFFAFALPAVIGAIAVFFVRKPVL